MLPAHTDILDNVLFFTAPFVAALGLLSRRFRGRLGSFAAMAILAGLLVDTSQQLPFPDSFAFPEGGATPSAVVALGLLGTAGLLLLAVVLAPRATAWLLTSLLMAPALSLVVYAACAVAASNPYVHHDGFARDSLDYVRVQMQTLGILAGLVYAASDDGARGPRLLGRSLVAGALPLCSLGWASGWGAAGLAGLAAALPILARLLSPRLGFGTWISLWLRWERVVVGAAVGLVVALGIGIAAPHVTILANKHASTGWVNVGGAGLLPMTSVYFLFPLLLAGLAHVRRPEWIPGLPVRVQRIPAWAVLGFLAAGIVMIGLLAQGETGLTTLVFVATVAWWLASSGRLVPTLAVLLVAAVAAAAGVVWLYTSPVALARVSGILDRLSWWVLGPDDGRMNQVTIAWAALRDAGWWGTGLRAPGGPLNVPAWQNDFFTLTAARFLGIGGAVGIVAAALLPACAVARGAADEPFHADADLARPTALFVVPWVVLWGGAAAWVSAGAMRLLPLSGVTMGLATPSTNHLVWTLPVIAWMAGRAAAQQAQAVRIRQGLARALHLTWLGVAAAATVIVVVGWRRLADRDDGWVLPLESSGWVRVARAGDGVALDGDIDARSLALGEEFTFGRAKLRVESGPSLALVGLHLSIDDLDHGVHFGLAGRHAPIHLPRLGLVETVALSNDVWLEDDAPTRWREFTLRRLGPQLVVEAPADGSDITVVAHDGGVCVIHDAGAHCPLADEARIELRDTYAFTVHDTGAGLDLDWTDGAPEAHLVPQDHGLLVGDRTVAAYEPADQVWAEEARPALGLLGQVGVFSLQDGAPEVGPEPKVPDQPKGSERALAEAARLEYRTWLVPNSKCERGWAWRGLRNPFGQGRCVAPRFSDAKGKAVYAGHFDHDDAGHIFDVRTTRTEMLDPVTKPEARKTRGMIRDRYGTPLYTWQDGTGWMPVEPWLAWLGARTIKDAALDPKHPERGTQTVTGYSGIQRLFHPLLVGREEEGGPWPELWRRLSMTPEPGGADVYLTLSLPVMRVAAQAAEAEARALAEAARRQGARRQDAEHRSCRAWDVDVVLTDADGAILAAVTAVGEIDDVTGDVVVVWETEKNRVSCLPSFDGPLRALSAPVMPGSTQKVWTYMLAGELSERGDPYVRFEEHDGDLWLLDRGDPDNGDGHYIEDHGVVEKVYGRNVPDCHDHGVSPPTGPIHFLDAFARSANAPACFLASAIQLGGDRIGPIVHALGLDGPLDLFPAFGDARLDHARFPLHLPFASGGRIEVLVDGHVSLEEATKSPLGKGMRPTPLGLTAGPRTVGNQGVYTPPYLLLGEGHDGRIEVYAPPPPSTRVVGPTAAAWVERAMLAVVQRPDGTAFRVMKGMNAVRWAELAVKTGTADTFTEVNGRQVQLPSPKAAVALYPVGSAAPVSIAVWARHAEGLDSDGALDVVRAVVESGALDATVTSR